MTVPDVTEADLMLLADIDEKLKIREAEAVDERLPEFTRELIRTVRIPVLRDARAKLANQLHEAGLL